MPYNTVEIVGRNAKDFGDYNTSFVHHTMPNYEYLLIAPKNGGNNLKEPAVLDEANNFKQLIELLYENYVTKRIDKNTKIHCRGLDKEDWLNERILAILEFATN